MNFLIKKLQDQSKSRADSTLSVVATWFCPAALSMLFLCSSAVLIWGSNRGFEMTDEGNYYLSYIYPEDFPYWHTYYHLIGRVVLNLLGSSIILFRLATMAGLLFSAWVFYAGFRDYLNALWPESLKTKQERICVAMAFLLSVFVSCSVSPIALTYNSLNSMALLIAIGFLLHGSARLMDSSRRNFVTVIGWFEIVLCWVLLGLDFFIKPSTSLVLLVLSLIFCFASPAVTPKNKMIFLGLLIIALCIFFGAAYLNINGFGLLAVRLKKSLTVKYAKLFIPLVMSTGTDLWFLLKSVFLDYWKVLASSLSAGLLLMFAGKERRDKTKLTQIVAGFICALWLAESLRLRYWQSSIWPNYHEGYVARFYLGSLLLIFIVLLIFSPIQNKKNADIKAQNLIHSIAFSIFLIAIPFIGAFGTGNPIYLNSLFQITPWIACAALLISFRSRRRDNRWIVGVGLLVISSFAFSQFLWGYTYKPYQLPENLWRQKYPTKIGPRPNQLLLDKRSHEYIEQIRSILKLNGFQKGDDILGFYHLPGVVYAVGGKSPGQPWYFGPYRNAFDLEKRRIKNLDPLRRNRAFILQQGDISKGLSSLREAGLQFPDNYTLCGEVFSPYMNLPVKIWRPRNR